MDEESKLYCDICDERHKKSVTKSHKRAAQKADEKYGVAI